MSFDRLGLRHSAVVRHDGHFLLFPWVGEARQLALVVALARAGLQPNPIGLAVAVAVSRHDALALELDRLAKSAVPNALDLAADVEQKAIEKFDAFLGEDLLTLAFAQERLDVSDLPRSAAELRASLSSLTATKQIGADAATPRQGAGK